MIPDWSPPTIGVLCVAVLLVTAGCTAVPIDESDLDADAIAENVQERHEEIDDLHGVQRTTIETDDEVTTTTAEIWEKPPNQYRQEVRSSTDEIAADGDTTVTNGTEMWSYSAADDVVRTFEFETDTGAGVGTIGATDGAQLERFLETFDVEYGGTDTVADRDVHVIRLTPSGEGDGDLAAIYDELELRVDEEYWYPLQQRAEVTVGGDSQTITTAFEEIEFNAGVDDARFAFDPPADAEVVSADEITTDEFDTLEAASDAAPFDVAAPDTPDDFDLETASVTDDGTGSSTVSATYAGPDDDLLWLSVVEERNEPSTGEAVSVDGTEATLVEGQVNSLYWECGDLAYSLSGDLAGEELVETAETVDCP